MGAILRWFHDDGVRHRVFYRTDDASHARELVIAASDWQAALPAADGRHLEDFSDDELVSLARRCRTQPVAR